MLANNGVVPISTATNQPGKLIKINGFPQRMTITPNGKTLYVTDRRVQPGLPDQRGVRPRR